MLDIVNQSNDMYGMCSIINMPSKTLFTPKKIRKKNGWKQESPFRQKFLNSFIEQKKLFIIFEKKNKIYDRCRKLIPKRRIERYTRIVFDISHYVIIEILCTLTHTHTHTIKWMFNIIFISSSFKTLKAAGVFMSRIGANFDDDKLVALQFCFI